MTNYLEMANEKILNKKYDEAIELCDKQIELGEDLANAYYQKARAFYKLYFEDKDIDFLQASLSLINEAITLNDKNDEFFGLSGDINWELTRNKRAEFDYSQAIELKPSAYNYYSRGLLYSGVEKFELAAKDFKKALELEPDDVDYLQELADSLNELDQFDNAIFYYKKALSINQSYYLYFNIGYAYRELRKYKEAIKYLEKAIELDPQIPEGYSTLAYVYTMLPPDKIERIIAKNKRMSYHKEFALYDYERNISYKNYNIAIDYMKKAIELDPQNDSFLWFLAKKYNEIDDYSNEIEIYNKLEKICPKDDDVYFRRGKSYYWSNNFENAISDFSKSIEIKPNNFSAYYFRGMARKKLDDDLLAIGDICFAAKNNDDSAIQYLNNNYDNDEVETMLSTTEKYQEICKQQDELKKDESETLNELYEAGKKIFEQQEYNELLQLCENAISEYEIKNEKIYNLKAAAEIMLQKYDDAKKDCEMALYINPKFEQAKINLNLIIKIQKQK